MMELTSSFHHSLLFVVRSSKLVTRPPVRLVAEMEDRRRARNGGNVNFFVDCLPVTDSHVVVEVHLMKLWREDWMKLSS